MEAMSDAVGPGDLVLCVNAAPNHYTGRPAPLQAGETYRVLGVMEFDCPCGRGDALLDVGYRFRLVPDALPAAAETQGPGQDAQSLRAQGNGNGSLISPRPGSG
jgi:hypothetical protein